MITIELPYKSTNEFQSKLLELRKQYSNIVRYSYNKYCEGFTQKEILFDCNNKLNNIHDLSGFIKLCAIMEGNQLYQRFGKKEDTKNIIFGGKYNFIQRCKNKITKEEYKNKKLLPLNIFADTIKKGNRHFKLNIIDENKITFKQNIKNHFDLNLPNLRNNYKKLLYKLQELNEIKHNEKGYGYSIKLDEKYIYISFEEFKNENIINLIENRYIGIDLNPTNIGISICENNNSEIKILKTIQFDFSKIINKIYNLKCNSSDKQLIYLQNKLQFELFQISKSISNLSKQFKCKYIFIEELNFKNNTSKNKTFNRLVKNLWKRNKFINNLNKRCNILGIKLIKVNPAYSSLIGNLQYDYIDSINASIEIGRRGFECIILKNKDKFYPIIKLKATFLHLWKEMENVIFKSWKEVYQYIKNLKIKYRVSLDECLHKFKVFSLNSIKSLIFCYNFI